MKYVSTRGGAKPCTYTEAAMAGLAPDGGLFVPENYPTISHEQLQAWRGLSYADLAYAVIHQFAEGFDQTALWQMCRETYTAQRYAHARDAFQSHEIAPVTWVADGLGILELSNGPTLSFKDMGMQFLGALFEYLNKKENKETNILGATSGDTGSAAEYAMRSREGVRVFMLSPKGRMSEFQRAQMYSLDDPNIFNIVIDGTFDDCQDIVKAIGQDKYFKAENSIGTVNSINWARLCAQVVYYFYSYLQNCDSVGEDIVYVVPSGNFGNIYAGWVAKQMGLPIYKLIVATNENDVLDEFFTTGLYRPRDPAHTYVTSSPSMDISKASNFERYIYDILQGDSERVCELWNELKEKGQFQLTPEEMQKVKASGFMSGSSEHANRLETIEAMHLEYDLYVDPHTADGLYVGKYKHPVGLKTLCLETAQPAKFPEIVKAATGMCILPPAGFKELLAKPQQFVELPKDIEAIKAFIEEKLAQDKDQ